MRQVFLAATLACLIQGYAAESAFPITLDKSGSIPSDWQSTDAGQGWMRDRFQVIKEGERSFMRVKDAPAAIQYRQTLDQGWKALSLSLETRRTDIKPGANAWDVPAVELAFSDASGKALDDWKRAQWLPTSTTGWEPLSRTYTIPKGSVYVDVRLSLKCAGTFDIAKIAVAVTEGSTSGKSALVKPRDADSPVRAFDFSTITGAHIDEASITETIVVDPTGAVPTIAAGIELAKPLLVAGTPVRIRIKPGHYREGELTIDGRQLGGKAETTVLVIEAEKKGTVTLSGAEVIPSTAWQAVAGTPGLFVTRWDKSLPLNPGGWGQYNPRAVYEHRREIMAIDGVPLRQVMLEMYSYHPEVTDQPTDSFAGVPQEVKKYGIYKFLGTVPPEQLPIGSFGIVERDPADRRLYLRLEPGKNPNASTTEISTRKHLLWLHNKGSVAVRGIHFEYAATEIEAAKAVMFGHWWQQDWHTIPHRHVLIEDCTFRRNNGNQLSFQFVGNVTMRRCQVTEGAYGGVITSMVENMLWEDNETSYNNWRVTGGWASGAVKVHNTFGMLVKGHTSIGNDGAGFWCDISCQNVRVEKLSSIGNKQGVDWEISRGFILTDSVLAGNKMMELAVVSGLDVHIERSILAGAAEVGVVAFQASNDRKSPDDVQQALKIATGEGTYGLDRLLFTDCAVVTWPQGQPTQAHADHEGTAKLGFVPDLIHQHHGNPDWFRTFVDSGIGGTRTLWWSPAAKPFGFSKVYSPTWNKIPSVNSTIDWKEFASRTAQTDGSFADPLFVAPEAFDFRLKPGSPLQGRKLPAWQLSATQATTWKNFQQASWHRYDGRSNVTDVILTGP